MEGQYAVLAVDGYQVGCNAQCTEIEQGNQSREGDAVVFGKGLHEFESYTASRQVVIRVGRVRTLGVEDGHCGWHHVVGNMMVADDEVYAQRLRVRYFVDCLDTAIEHDNQFYTVLCRIVYTLDADAVTFFVTVGDIVLHVGVELLQEFIHQSYCCTSIHVVVAPDHDALFSAHRVI